jgi:hypothetical protein
MMVLAVNEDQVTPGVIAFLVVAALGVTLFFLIRSMNKQISRIQAPREEDLRQAEWERRQDKPAPALRPEKAEHTSEGDQRDT